MRYLAAIEWKRGSVTGSSPDGMLRSKTLSGNSRAHSYGRPCPAFLGRFLGGSRFGIEQVASASNSPNITGILGIRLDMFSQPENVIVDGSRGLTHVVVPNLLEQLTARVTTSPGWRIRYSSSRNSRSVTGSSLPARRSSWRRKSTTMSPNWNSAGVDVFRSCGAGRRVVAEMRAQPREQLAQAERLGHVVVGARARGRARGRPPRTRDVSMITLVLMCRSRIRLQISNPLIPGSMRSSRIRSGCVSSASRSPSGPVAADLDFVALVLERAAQPEHQRVVFLDDQDARHVRAPARTSAG